MLLENMITVQLNLYILLYRNTSKSFDVLSTNKDKLAIPYVQISHNDHSIKDLLNQILSSYTLIESLSEYRLLNNFLIDSIYHSVYFCTIPNNSRLKDNIYTLPINTYAIHSPNIQQILRFLR